MERIQLLLSRYAIKREPFDPFRLSDISFFEADSYEIGSREITSWVSSGIRGTRINNQRQMLQTHYSAISPQLMGGMTLTR